MIQTIRSKVTSSWRLLVLLCLLCAVAVARAPLSSAQASNDVPSRLNVAAPADGNCQSSTSPTCDYSSPDRLAIPSLNEGDPSRCGSTSINAPVNVYDMQGDASMGIPIADCDVVLENFAAFAGYGGYPGDGGTTVLAGHVDYHPNYQAVFWNLRSIQIGAQINYTRYDGTVISYTVDWAQAISDPSYDWSGLVSAGSTESLVLITCDGVFNPATHEYDHRFVAHAVRN